MQRVIALGLVVATSFAPTLAGAQDDLLVLVVEAGDSPLNQPRLVNAIASATHREVIRMTDERAPLARGRLSIAYQRPNRWVLRYEAGGQVAWITDRVDRASELRSRLAALSASVVTVIDGAPRATSPEPEPTPEARPRRPRGSWDDDIILALRDELVDPFAEEPPPSRGRRALLWSEVVDPFASPSERGRTREVWSEVLDPWAPGIRRRR